MSKKEIEVWKVEVDSRKYVGEHTVYHVAAMGAAMAERKALALAKRDNITRPYVLSAAFEHYIDA